MVPYFKKAIGVDLSQNMISESLKNVSKGVELINKDIREVEMMKNSVDYIVSHTMLHHINDDLEPTLEKFKKSLKIGGKIVVVDIVSKGLMRNHSDKVRIFNAFLKFISNLPKIGLKKSFIDFKKATNKTWMEHLRHDVFLDEVRLKQVFSNVFPDIKFNTIKREFGLNTLLICDWTKKGEEGKAYNN